MVEFVKHIQPGLISCNVVVGSAISENHNGVAAGDGSHRVDCEQLSALLRSRDNCGSHLSPDLGFIKRSELRCGRHKLRQSLSTSELAKSAFEMVVRNLSEVAKPHVTFDTSSSPLPRPHLHS